jgi:hypothetical protein
MKQRSAERVNDIARPYAQGNFFHLCRAHPRPKHGGDDASGTCARNHLNVYPGLVKLIDSPNVRRTPEPA